MSSIDPRAHRGLFQSLQGTLGSRQADTLMTMLDRAEGTDLATKKDLDALRIASKADIEGLRAATKADMESLEGKMRHELKEIGTRVGLRFETFDHKLEATEHRMASQIDRALREQTRTLTFALVGALAALATVNLTALVFVA